MAYTQPDAAALKLRFPAFSTVDVDTIDYWLNDARLTVTADWIEADRAPAEMELAAHNMTLNGLGSGGGAVGDLSAMGVTSFKSASFSVNFADGGAGKGEGYAATKYGALFKVRLRRNGGGPRLVGCA